jgi:periplasmic protein TonB
MNERLRRQLTAYEAPAPLDDRARLLGRLLGACLAIAAALGLLLFTVEITPAGIAAAARAPRITYIAPPPPPEPTPAATPEPVVETPPEAALAPAVDQPGADSTPPVASEPRRVYGVRQVFSRGLGTTGQAPRMGIVVKRGNTLDGVADTLTATEADLAGPLVALSTVERAPEPIHRVVPEYSAAMLAARASGTVTARLLIDDDGRVAAVEVLEDIGYDSRALAVAAFRQFRFRPALRGGEPVAVWIVHRIRFEFQE